MGRQVRKRRYEYEKDNFNNCLTFRSHIYYNIDILKTFIRICSRYRDMLL